MTLSNSIEARVAYMEGVETVRKPRIDTIDARLTVLDEKLWKADARNSRELLRLQQDVTQLRQELQTEIAALREELRNARARGRMRSPG